MAITKRTAIMESALKLLDAKPLNKISVKDIVEDCGVNRNTFYYHFEDMPALIEAIVLDEVDKVIGKDEDFESIQAAFEAGTQMLNQHKRAVYHIYNSGNRDIFERSLMQISTYTMTKYIDHEAEGMRIRPHDREIIIRAVSCECFGLVIDWLAHGMTDKARDDILRIWELRMGSVRTMLERSRIL